MALGLGPKKPADDAPKGTPPAEAVNPPETTPPSSVAKPPEAPPSPKVEAPRTEIPRAEVARTEVPRTEAPAPVKPLTRPVAVRAADVATPAPKPRRRLGIGATVAVYIVSSVAIWAVAAWTSTFYASRPWDFTSQRDFTLEKETVELLKRVNQPLHLTALFSKQGEVRQHVLEEVEALVDLMKVETRSLDYRRIDPDRDPAAAYALIARLKLENDPQRYRDSVVVEYAGKSSLIPITKLALVELTKEGNQVVPKEKAFHGEYAIATALLNLLEDQHAKVYLTAGHGELDPENPDKDGFQYARAALREEKTIVERLFLLEVDKVPADASSIVIAGPTEPFDTQEVVKIEKFIEGGGGLLLCLGPQKFSGLEAMLARYGVELGRDMVVDPANKRAARSPADLIVRKLGNHPIVNPLTTSTIEVANCRSLRRVENPAVLDPKLLRTELLWSSDKSWAETDLSQSKFTRTPEAGDVNGPVALATAVNIPPDPNNPRAVAQGGIRLALFGSRDVFSNFWLMRSPANGDLFQNAVHWIAKRDRLATMRPRSPSVRLLTLTERQVRWVALTAYAGIPALFLVAGLLIAWRRRA